MRTKLSKTPIEIDLSDGREALIQNDSTNNITWNFIAHSPQDGYILRKGEGILVNYPVYLTADSHGETYAQVQYL